MEISYKPEFASEYYELKGGIQYPMFVATALGIKRCYDDWIPTGRFDEFKALCAKYNLHYETDVIFTYVKSKENIVGSETITTTFARAQPCQSGAKGDVHVFIAKKKADAIEAKKYGWYSIIVGNRMTHKIHVDHMRFGRALGFPDCCVDFFRRYNNWNFYSNPQEAFKRTKKPSYYCNNLLMDNTFFYIHHIPCRYDCPETIRYAKKIENAIRLVEPEFVEEARRRLSMPLLVFSERDFIIFDGKMKGDKIAYRYCHYYTNYSRPEDSIDFFDRIKEGDEIKDGNVIRVFRKGKEIFSFPKKERWFFIGFD